MFLFPALLSPYVSVLPYVLYVPVLLPLRLFSLLFTLAHHPPLHSYSFLLLCSFTSLFISISSFTASFFYISSLPLPIYLYLFPSFVPPPSLPLPINSPLPIFFYLFFALLFISRHFHFPIYSSYLPSSYLLIPPSFFNSLPPLPLPIYSSWSPPPSSSAHLPYFPLLMNSSVPLPFFQLHKIIYPSSSQRSSLSSTVLPPPHYTYILYLPSLNLPNHKRILQI